MNKTIIVAVVVALLLIGGGAVYLKSSKNKSTTSTSTMAKTPTVQPSPTMPEASPSAAAITEAAMGNVKEFTIQGGNYYFKPNEIKVKKGDQVKITFTNAGGFHDFVIDEFNVKTDTIKSDATATVEFTADKAGTFEFYCSVGNHRQMGMKGTLTVE